MKKLLLFFTVFIICSRLMAQHVVVTYDATKGTSTLVGATSVYMHSGGNDSTVMPVGGSCWHCVIGNWGMDDGVGKMTNIGTDLWQMDIPDAWAYYDAATGCDFAGTTVTCIGMVFRNADGTLTGKDSSNSDIFVDLQGGVPMVYNSSLTPFNGVTVTESPTGISSINSSNAGVHCYPNPMNTIGTLAYSLDRPSVKVTLSIFDVTGKQMMEIVRSNEVRGNHQINFSTENLEDGVYLYSLNTGGKIVSDRFCITKN